MSRGFSPPWFVTLGAVLLCALFVRLGYWQWERGNARQAQWSKFNVGAGESVALGSRGLDQVQRFQRVTVVGRFDTEHQFLLDNRTNNGNAGYEVLTPLDRPNGFIALVDRGWVPFSGSRAKLPSVAFAAYGPVTLSGRTDELPTAGLASGRAAPLSDGGWPKVTSYPTMNELKTALGGRPLEQRILLLDPQEPNGYVRDWHPPGIQPVRHWSYAIQWWCFAVVTLVFWVIVGRRASNEGK